MKRYYVYILACRTQRLYIGVTNDLTRRIQEHKVGRIEGFTQRYHIDRLVYYEEFTDIRLAIAREKYLKNRHRDWKITLIESTNPHWQDLAGDWFAETLDSPRDPADRSGPQDDKLK